MDRFLSRLVDKVPPWFLVVVIASLFAWFVGLSYVAVAFSRSVEFFPPRIGSDERLLAEIQSLRLTLQAVSTKHYEQVTLLRQQLAEARSRAAEASSEFSASQYDYARNAEKYEAEIKELESQFSARLNEINERLVILEQRF